MRRVCLVVALLIALAAGPAHAATSSTVTVYGDREHDNRVTGTPEPPLGVRWATQLGAAVSYPVVAGGSAFVTVRPAGDGSYGTEVIALDLATGAVRWRRAESGTYYWSGLAYDQGRLIVVNYDGRVTAVDPATGATLWSRQLDQYSFSTPPVATDGHVYVTGDGSGSTVYALRASDGAQEWKYALPSGPGTPAVDASRVYVSMVCEHAVALDRATGARRWSHDGGCAGGGEATAALYGGRMYPLGDNGAIYDAATGATVGAANFQGAVAFADGTAYTAWQGGVLAADAASWVTRWLTAASRDSPVNGDAPLLAGSHLYVASEAAYVAALLRSDGAVAWCASTAGEPVYASTGNVDRPDSGLGAGSGMLLVPAGRFLVAYGPGGATPAPCGGASGGSSPGTTGPGPSAPVGPSLSLVPVDPDVLAGHTAKLRGRLSGTAASVAGVRVTLQADPWPFDGRWQTVGHPVTAADGTYGSRRRPGRNTRYRALASGLTSAPATVYAELTARITRRVLSSSRFHETVTISGPRSVRLSARRLAFYVARAGSRTARLKAMRPLRRVRAGRYTSAATLRFLVPRRKTVVVACYRERTPDPWGRPSPIDPRCGRSRLTLPAPATASAATATIDQLPGRDATWRFTARG